MKRIDVPLHDRHCDKSVEFLRRCDGSEAVAMCFLESLISSLIPRHGYFA